MARRIVLAGLLAAFVLLPVLGDAYLLAVGARVIIYGILALSLNFIIGYGGLLSFGHAAYFGAGAYTIGILDLAGITSGWIAFSAAILFAALLALTIGALALRTRGLYFIMITFAFAQMLYFLAIGQRSLGGSDGTPLKRRSDFGDLIDLSNVAEFYFMAGILLALVLYFFHRLQLSRFGLLLGACRQNETRLLSIGIATYPYKLAAFVIAGAMAGLAGALVANLEGYVSPYLLDWRTSGILMMMIVLGGVGSLYGPLVGAILYIGLEAAATRYTTHWMALLGVFLVLVALYWNQGIMGMVEGLRGRRSIMK